VVTGGVVDLNVKVPEFRSRWGQRQVVMEFVNIYSNVYVCPVSQICGC